MDSLKTNKYSYWHGKPFHYSKKDNWQEKYEQFKAEFKVLIKSVLVEGDTVTYCDGDSFPKAVSQDDDSKMTKWFYAQIMKGSNE